MHTLEQLRSGALAGARRLDLSCGLTEVPPEVFDLADSLEVLNLTGNRLQDLPEDLARLHQLKILFASSNAFTRVPEVVGACPALEMVGFKANRIRELPAAALPPRLRWLILTDNALQRLPQALGERPALQKLMLSGNRLAQLPESLAQARALELLRLSANRLGELPAWLLRLPRLSWLAVAGNPALPEAPPLRRLPVVDWSEVQLGALIGEGASGRIHRARIAGRWASGDWVLKLFRAAVTSDGLPEHEMAAGESAGDHPALCTPVARLDGHSQGLHGMVLPRLPEGSGALAGPPSFDTCTRDVYPTGLRLSAEDAVTIARQMAQALTHLHARQVLHGDFYAHNILWNGANRTALLSDLGGATVLGAAGPSAQALLATDVRAFGVLLEELLHQVTGPSGAFSAQAPAHWPAWVAACTQDDPRARPTMAEVCDALARV